LESLLLAKSHAALKSKAAGDRGAASGSTSVVHRFDAVLKRDAIRPPPFAAFGVGSCEEPDVDASAAAADDDDGVVAGASTLKATTFPFNVG